jgi:two-component system OmpR family response regulator
MTVLVIEDDPNVLAFIDRMLTQSGHTVLAAEDPDHARFVLTEHGGPPDLLLIDIVLPGSNGLDFARAAKAANPALKIIFMTGLVHQSPKVLRSGLGPVLHKPFSSDELLKTIENL